MATCSPQERYFPYGEAETAWLKARDRRLGAVIEAVGHIERTVDTDLYAAVVRHIVAQQISNKALQTVWRRLVEAVGGIAPSAVQSAGRAALQACGMSARKADYILDFTGRVLCGTCDLEAIRQMPDAEAIAALSSLKGVGVWTAEMILLFCLCRPDILSYGDLAIQRGMRMVYRHRVITEALFAKYRARLSPYGSVASLYFWAAAGGAVPGLADPAAKGAPPRREGRA